MDSGKEIIENYEMGFINSIEVCMRFKEILTFFGSDGALENAICKELEPLARFLMDNFKNHKYERIENFDNLKQNYI